MYAFSVSGTARKDLEHTKAGDTVPFIVYINFKDLFGAEQLCKVYLMRAGFTDIKIEKRKGMERLAKNARAVAADKWLKEAVDRGYSIQMFDEE